MATKEEIEKMWNVAKGFKHLVILNNGTEIKATKYDLRNGLIFFYYKKHFLYVANLQNVKRIE